MAVESRYAIIRWDANTEPDLAGYTYYYGRAPGVYLYFGSVGPGVTGVQIDVGSTAPLFSNGSADGPWYFAVDAFDDNGNHSELSDEVSKFIMQTRGQFIKRI